MDSIWHADWSLISPHISPIEIASSMKSLRIKIFGMNGDCGQIVGHLDGVRAGGSHAHQRGGRAVPAGAGGWHVRRRGRGVRRRRGQGRQKLGRRDVAAQLHRQALGLG